MGLFGNGKSDEQQATEQGEQPQENDAERENVRLREENTGLRAVAAEQQQDIYALQTLLDSMVDNVNAAKELFLQVSDERRALPTEAERLEKAEQEGRFGVWNKLCQEKGVDPKENPLGEDFLTTGFVPLGETEAKVVPFPRSQVEEALRDTPVVDNIEIPQEIRDEVERLRKENPDVEIAGAFTQDEEGNLVQVKV